jgi:hypothetical protein
MFQNYNHNSFSNSFNYFFLFKSIQLNLERNNGRDDRRKKFNRNLRKTLENDIESRKWTFRISNLTEEQVIEIRDRIIIQNLCTRVMSIRDSQITILLS